jgi:hypothetical protein
MDLEVGAGGSREGARGSGILVGEARAGAAASVSAPARAAIQPALRSIKLTLTLLARTIGDGAIGSQALLAGDLALEITDESAFLSFGVSGP